MKPSDLKRLRASKKLTMKQLSALTGIHPPHISEIENGRRPLSADAKKKIMAALKADEQASVPPTG